MNLLKDPNGNFLLLDHKTGPTKFSETLPLGGLQDPYICFSVRNLLFTSAVSSKAQTPSCDPDKILTAYYFVLPKKNSNSPLLPAYRS